MRSPSHLVIPVVQYELEQCCVEPAPLRQRRRQRLEEVSGDKAEGRGQVLLVKLVDNLPVQGEPRVKWGGTTISSSWHQIYRDLDPNPTWGRSTTKAVLMALPPSDLSTALRVSPLGNWQRGGGSVE